MKACWFYLLIEWGYTFSYFSLFLICIFSLICFILSIFHSVFMFLYLACFDTFVHYECTACVFPSQCVSLCWSVCLGCVFFVSVCARTIELDKFCWELIGGREILTCSYICLTVPHTLTHSWPSPNAEWWWEWWKDGRRGESDAEEKWWENCSQLRCSRQREREQVRVREMRGDKTYRGRMGESEDKVISMSIPSLEKNTGSEGGVEHQGITWKGKENERKRIWRFWRALWQRKREGIRWKQEWEDGRRTGAMITGSYGSQEPLVNRECVRDGWNWTVGKKKKFRYTQMERVETRAWVMKGQREQQNRNDSLPRARSTVHSLLLNTCTLNCTFILPPYFIFAFVFLAT